MQYTPAVLELDVYINPLEPAIQVINCSNSEPETISLNSKYATEHQLPRTLAKLNAKDMSIILHYSLSILPSPHYMYL